MRVNHLVRARTPTRCAKTGMPSSGQLPPECMWAGQVVTSCGRDITKKMISARARHQDRHHYSLFARTSSLNSLGAASVFSTSPE